jgi:hypothetical protein
VGKATGERIAHFFNRVGMSRSLFDGQGHLVDRLVMVGNSAACRKSADTLCSTRCAFPVSKLLASISTVTDESSTSRGHTRQKIESSNIL